jgi:hypothetical protein
MQKFARKRGSVEKVCVGGDNRVVDGLKKSLNIKGNV